MCMKILCRQMVQMSRYFFIHHYLQALCLWSPLSLFAKKKGRLTQKIWKWRKQVAKKKLSSVVFWKEAHMHCLYQTIHFSHLYFEPLLTLIRAVNCQSEALIYYIKSFQCSGSRQVCNSFDRCLFGKVVSSETLNTILARATSQKIPCGLN